MSNIDLYFGISLVGIIFGLGAAIVILFLGVLSLRSNFWFRNLNATDRVTIPMLWFGGILLAIASILSFNMNDLAVDSNIKFILSLILLVNGAYLTFIFAPVIRKLENDGKTTFLTLPMPHQILIFIAGTISALSWTTHAIILWLEIIR